MSIQLLTVRDVSEVLQCSEDAVIRRFAKMDGVIDLGKTTLGVPPLSCAANSENCRRAIFDEQVAEE